MTRGPVPAEVRASRLGVEAVRCWVPGRPLPQPRPRFNSKTGRTYTPASATDHKGYVRSVVAANRDRFRMGATSDDFSVYLDLCTTSVQSDVDNMAKLVLDAMNDLVYDDDRRVTLLVCRKTIVPKTEMGTGVLVVRHYE